MSAPTSSRLRSVVGDWRALARCAEADPELFFPPGESGPIATAQEQAAKAICARCPVVRECLVWALAELPHGIAGGLTEAERRTYRQSQSVVRVEGSHGGNRAPLLIFTAHKPVAGTRALEGDRG